MNYLASAMYALRNRVICITSEMYALETAQIYVTSAMYALLFKLGYFCNVCFGKLGELITSAIYALGNRVNYVLLRCIL